MAEPAIRLCGDLEFTLEGRSLAHALPGRQGRLVLAYLICHRDRAVSRDELADLLWPEQAPARPDDVLGALLSKLRRVLGADALRGRQELRLELPGETTVDTELAAADARAADAALAAGDASAALEHARQARAAIAGEFLPGHEQPWVQERRRELAELTLDAAETLASAGLALGGPQLIVSERAARELIAAEALRERGYRLLMEVLAAREDLAGALAVYEELRVKLREELGIVPGAATRALHERLVRGDEGVRTEGEPGPARAAQPPHEPDPAREERKLVTILAAQLEGAGADPEDLRAAAARVQREVAAELERLGAGLYSGAAQGTVIALFGAAHGHEDDPERAVRTGADWLERGLVARARVSSRELLVTEAGEVIGLPLEAATRIARDAPQGTLHVDAATYEATRHTFPYVAEPFGGSWRLRPSANERSFAKHPEPATQPLEHPPLVGRRDELALLADLQRRVREERRPRLVMLTGQAGVGKSRLVDELLARTDGTAVYRGRCLPYGEGITFWPLREILWWSAGIQLDDEAAVAAAKLRARVRSALGEAQAERVTAALAIAAGITVPDNPIARLTPGAVAEEIGLAWPAFLSALAGAEPAIVVVEDLHWAEEPLLDMLELMLARARGSLLLIVTARPEFAQARAGWGSLEPITRVALEPLTETESRELVAALLPHAPPAVQAEVVATSEGNPFFAEELARHIGQEGQPPQIPNTVRALIAARVDGLSESAKHALQDAAVVGRVFWRATLDAIEPRAELMPALNELERRGLVVTRPGSELPGETELVFRHGLIREVVYRSIPRARRCRAHAAVGLWLERLAGDRREEFVELLAHHFEAASAPGDASLAWPEGSPEHAELKAKAVRALIDAGAAARRRMTLEQALRYAHRAEALATSLQERLAATELEGRAHHAALRSDEAREAYSRAMELAQSLGDQAALQQLRAHALLLCIRYQGTFSGESWRPWAIQLVEEGLAADSGAPSFTRGALLLARAWCARRWLEGGDLAAAKQDARQAIAIAREVGAPELHGAAVEALTWFVFEEGFCEAERMAERLLSVAAASADRGEAHESLVTAAMSFTWAGRFERARAVARQATERGVELGGHRALHSAAAETLCLVPTGRFAELGAATSRVLELTAQEGEKTCMPALVGLAGRALWLFETLDQAGAHAAAELLARLRPSGARPLHEYAICEMLRPFLPSYGALQEPPGGRAIDSILALRARLPTLVLAGEYGAVERDLEHARRLATTACAPALGWIADWAAALATPGEDSLAGVLEATAALDDYGERYTAARLRLDAAGLLPHDAGAELAARAAERFEELGALASAAAAAQVAATVARTSEL